MPIIASQLINKIVTDSREGEAGLRRFHQLVEQERKYLKDAFNNVSTGGDLFKNMPGGAGGSGFNLKADLDTKKADAALDKLEEKGRHMHGVFSTIFGLLGKGLAAAFSGGMSLLGDIPGLIGPLKDAFTDIIDKTNEAQAVQTQLQAVLKSTGDASGMTADAINSLASSLASVTPFSKEAILSGQNILLTFTNIGQSVFPQATQAILDVSQAMHQDLKSSAVQLGKALDDPIKGITALTRIGVTFTQQQKDMIKQMVAAGDVAGAQKIILDELQREFGGSAQAAGGTFAGALQILQNKLSELEVKVGEKLLPVLNSLLTAVQPLVGWLADQLSNALDQVGNLFSWLAGIWNNDVLPPLKQWGPTIISLVERALKPLADQLRSVGSNAVSLKPLLDGISAAVSNATYFVYQLLYTIDNGAGAFRNTEGILGVIIRTVDDFRTSFKSLSDDIAKGQGPIGQIASLFQQVGAFVVSTGQAFSPLIGIVGKLVVLWGTGLGNAFKQTASDWIPIIKDLVNLLQTKILPVIVPPLLKLIDIIVSKGVPAFWAVRDAVAHVAAVIVGTVMPVFNTWWPILAKVVGFVLDLAGKALGFLLPKIQEGAKAVSHFATEMSTRLAPFIKNIAGVITFLAGVIQTIWGFIWPWASSILKTAWDIISSIISVAWDIITGIFKIGADLLSGNWGQLWKDVQDTLGNVWNDIKTFFGNMWGDIQGIWNALWNNVSSVVSGVWNTVSTAVKNGINGIIDLIDGIIDKINSIPSVPGWPRIHIPDIPHLATGTSNFGGGPAIMNEQGGEMAILPGGSVVIPHDETDKILTQQTTHQQKVINIYPSKATFNEDDLKRMLQVEEMLSRIAS